MIRFPITRVIELVGALRPNLSQSDMDNMILPFIEAPLDNTQPGTPVVAVAGLVSLMNQHKLLEPVETGLPVFLQWVFGFSMHVMTTFTHLRLTHGKAFQDMLTAIQGALNTGIHARRQALSEMCDAIRGQMFELNEESNALLGKPATPLNTDTWIPLGRLIKVLLNPDFAWDNFPETVPFRHVSAYIDTVNGMVRIADGNGEPGNIEMLESACERAKGTGRNPFLIQEAVRNKEARAKAASTAREPSPLILGPDARPVSST